MINGYIVLYLSIITAGGRSVIFIHKITGEIFELGLYDPEVRGFKDTILLIDENVRTCLFFKKNFDFIGWL